MRKVSLYLNKLLLILLSFCISVCMLSGCSEDDKEATLSQENSSEIDEQFISELFINEETVSEEYIKQNLIIEEGIYELRYNENIIAQSYIIETVVSENSVDRLKEQLPSELDEYDIDWGKVIGKFAVGTSIIIAVGVVNAFAKSTYFVFSSTEVAKDALVGGAMAISLNEILKCYNKGKDDVYKATKKYTIESFADGYMTGAISSVLKIGSENFRRLKSFKLENGNKYKIKIDGSVLNENGRKIGIAMYDKNEVWHLINDVTGEISYFDKKGKMLTTYSVNEYKNTRLRVDFSDDYKICRVDDYGKIIRENDELLPNIEYTINGYQYKTDKFKRISEVSFDELKLKETGQKRLTIQDTMEVISRGEGTTSMLDRGHLIADRFNGDNTLANIVAMDRNVNQIKYKAIEDYWFQVVMNGGNVSGKIGLDYSYNSNIPKSIEIIYNIGYGMIKEVIRNY